MPPMSTAPPAKTPTLISVRMQVASLLRGLQRIDVEPRGLKAIYFGPVAFVIRDFWPKNFYYQAIFPEETKGGAMQPLPRAPPRQPARSAIDEREGYQAIFLEDNTGWAYASAPHRSP